MSEKMSEESQIGVLSRIFCFKTNTLVRNREFIDLVSGSTPVFGFFDLINLPPSCQITVRHKPWVQQNFLNEKPHDGRLSKTKLVCSLLTAMTNYLRHNQFLANIFKLCLKQNGLFGNLPEYENL